MQYTVMLLEVHGDGLKSVAMIAEHMTARKSLKAYRELCAIGKAYVRDNEWKSYECRRFEE